MKKNVQIKRIYQNNDGSFLPDSSQPCPEEDYQIISHKYTPHSSTRYINIISENTKTQIKNKEEKTKKSDKKLPELYSNREDCCGCAACYVICPEQAIFMAPDEEGFLYPVIDAMKCIRCYKCISVCPFKLY